MSPHQTPDFTIASQHDAQKTGTIAVRPKVHIGDRVWFWSSGLQPGSAVLDRTQPWEARIIYVHPRLAEEGQMVNLSVTDHVGNVFVCHDVPLRAGPPDGRERHYGAKPQYASPRRES